MRLAFPVAFATAMLASVAVPTTARAMGAVVSSPPGAASPIALRFAVATSEEPGAVSARWASVTVQGSATAVAWIVPARPGALLQLSPDAWLDALEAATAPRVVPPDPSPPCGFAGGVEVDGSFTPTATIAPGSSGIAADRPTLDAILERWGLSVSPELSAPIDAALASGSELLALLFTDVSGTVVTRTLRIVDDSPPDAPLSLLTGGDLAVQVTAFALSPSASELGPSVLSLDPAAILWRSDGTSTYAAVRDALLAASPGRWLLETSGASLVSAPTALPDGSTIPSLTSAYEALAANDSNDGDAGAQDDLALALGAADAADAGASEPWLARSRTVIPAGAFGQDALLATAPPAAVGPLYTASAYAETCEASVPPPSPPQSTGGSAPPSSGEGHGTSGGVALNAGASAVSAAADSTDGCGGDSSEDSSGGCGGDSSSSDGSDSGSDSSEGCSGSSTDSSDDSGGGCSGSDDSSSSSDCSVNASRRGPRRSATTRLLVVLVGAAALYRRRRADQRTTAR